MATSNTVAAVKTALVTALTSAIADSTVQVLYGRPQDHLVRREAVFVADVDYASQIANIKAGRKSYDEIYSIDVVFSVGRSIGESADAEARAFALFEFLRDLLAEESGAQGLGVDGVWSLVIESVDSTTLHSGEGPTSVVVATVRCQARVE